MLSFITFNLKRIYKDKMFIVLCGIIFIVFFIILHLDYLLEDHRMSIAVDETTGVYQNYFKEINSENSYYLSNEENEIIIHLEKETWMIYSQNELSEQQQNSIEKDIKEVVKLRYKRDYPFMSEYIQELDEQILFDYRQQQKSSPLIFVATIAFFLILNFSSSLANETIYEKGSHFIKVLLTYMEVKDYIIAKVIESFIVPLIHGGISVSLLLINIAIRYFEDHLKGLERLFQSYGNSTVIEIDLNVTKIIMIVVFMISSLVLIELFIMFIVSRFTSSSQASIFISIVYMILLLAYFSILIFENRLDTTVVSKLCYFPMFSIVLLPTVVLQSEQYFPQMLIGLIINGICIFVVIRSLMAQYKENMLKN